jgi:hypothetical protein
MLFVGDGSLHMTVQEISTIIRNGFKPTIILINNSGYTIERVIHGPVQQYNDISEEWDYQNMLNFFGARPSETSAGSRSYSARTYEELATVLTDPAFIKNDTIQLLEAFMNKFDSPWILARQVNVVHGRFGEMQEEEDKRVGRKRRTLDTNLYKSMYRDEGLESTRLVTEIEGDIPRKKEGKVGKMAGIETTEITNGEIEVNGH